MWLLKQETLEDTWFLGPALEHTPRCAEKEVKSDYGGPFGKEGELE